LGSGQKMQISLPPPLALLEGHILLLILAKALVIFALLAPTSSGSFVVAVDVAALAPTSFVGQLLKD